jgi:hypothetical protein
LLVSESDVENYKQIKADLDELRLLVEKSELWVYKAKSSDEDGGEKKKEKKVRLTFIVASLFACAVAQLHFLYIFLFGVNSTG